MLLGVFDKKQKRYYSFSGAQSVLSFKEKHLSAFLQENKTALTVQKEQVYHFLIGQAFYQKEQLSALDIVAQLKKDGQCWRKLNGNWAFGMWDPEKQELLLARDKSGVHSLFYYDVDEMLVFSDDLSALLQCRFIPKALNEDAVVQLGVGYKRDGQTLYKNINSLTSAYYLKVNTSGAKQLNYWLPSLSPLLYPAFDDYVAHFRALYSNAVRQSLVGFSNPGIALSSGLDSGSVYALAVEQGAFLHPLTWRATQVDEVYRIKNRTYDETVLVRQLINRYQQELLTIVNSSKGGMLDGIIELITACHIPTPVLPHMQEVYKAAQTLGLDVLLNGFGGNFTVSLPGKASLQNSDKGLLSKLLFFMKSGRQNLSGIYRTLKGVRNTNRDYVRRLAIKAHENKYSTIAEEMDKRRREYENQPQAYVLGMLQGNILNGVNRYTSALGVESRTPVFDDQLIEFCLRTPQEIFHHKGTPKALLKTAMKGSMPPELLHNPNRGLQGVNYSSKFRHEYAEFMEVINAFKASPLIQYWLDLDLIETQLKLLAYPELASKRQFGNLAVVFRGIQLGLLLKSIEDGR